jgi:hypothetical protein
MGVPPSTPAIRYNEHNGATCSAWSSEGKMSGSLDVATLGEALSQRILQRVSLG